MIIIIIINFKFNALILIPIALTSEINVIASPPAALGRSTAGRVLPVASRRAISIAAGAPSWHGS